MYCFRLLAPLALLILVAAPVHATLQAEAVVRNGSGTTNNVLCSNGGWGSTTALASCSDAGNFGFGEARANYGSLHTYARIHSDSPPTGNLNYQSYAIARFDDEISLGSPLLTSGESTDVRIVMALDGLITREQPPFLAGGTASVPWTFRVVINGLEVQPSNGPRRHGALRSGTDLRCALFWMQRGLRRHRGLLQHGNGLFGRGPGAHL